MKKVFYYFLGILGAIFLFIIISISTYLVLNHFKPSISSVLFERSDLAKIKNKLPKIYTIYSGSMEPAIKTASIIISLPQDTYLPSDVITFPSHENSKQMITHRIEFKNYPNGIDNDPVYLTSGDANEELDRWEVKNDQIVGKVVFSLPFLGYVADFAKKPQGFILLVIIPATIIIYEELKFLINETKKVLSKLKTKYYQRKGYQVTNKPIKNKKFSKLAVIFPLTGALIVIISVSIGLYADYEKSKGNVMSAANVFPTFAPSEPSSTPTPQPDTETPTPTPEQPQNPVINEFMPNPLGISDTDEWIELYNPSLSSINLDNWILDDIEGGSTPFVLTGKSINAISFLVIDKSESGIGLNNSEGDTVRLIDSSNNLIDSYTYPRNPAENVSIGRETDGNLPWISCSVVTKGSSNNVLCGI